MATHFSHYASPLGAICLAADKQGLSGLWLEGQNCPLTNAELAALPRTDETAASDTTYRHGHEALPCDGDTEQAFFAPAKRWLDLYFSGSVPDISVPLHLNGTDFQREVWEILLSIPYGKTTSYGAIAAQLAARRGIKRMSAQAVGGAVGRNPVSIIVPCHRVIGANGSLTGYAGGIEKKRWLLHLEGVL